MPSRVRPPGCSSLASGVGNKPALFIYLVLFPPLKGGKDPEEGSVEGPLWDPRREEQEVQAAPGCQEPWGGRTHQLETSLSPHPAAGLAASVTTGTTPTALGAVEGWEGGAQMPQGNR